MRLEEDRNPDQGGGIEAVLCKIPSFRPVVVKLLRVVNDPKSSLSEVSALLNSDPALSAEVLTVANSAAYGAAHRITTTARALAMLGTERTKAVATRAAMYGMLRGIGNTVAVRNCWVHSRAVSVIAEWLSPSYRIHPHKGYTIGLLHDIGRLGLLALDPNGYSTLLDTVTGTNEYALELERKVFRVDHCEAGAWLTKSWGLTEEFQIAASLHHTHGLETMKDSCKLVSLACALAQSFGYRAAPLVEGQASESILLGLPEIARSTAQISILSDQLEREVGRRPSPTESKDCGFVGKSDAA